MIALNPRDRETVADIIDRYFPGIPRSVFGSRAVGGEKPFSDLDLLIETKVPMNPAVLGMLKEDFSESDLPFRVDVVDKASASESFIDLIKDDLVPLD